MRSSPRNHARTLEEKPAVRTVRELDAITWAAKNAGVSYGVFAMSLKPEQYKGIFESYCEEILRRKREEQAWLRSAPAAKSKRPGMREDI